MKRLVLATIATAVLALAAGPVLADGGAYKNNPQSRFENHGAYDVRARHPSAPSQFWPLHGKRPDVHQRRHTRQAYRHGGCRHRFAAAGWHRHHGFHRYRNPYRMRFAPPPWHWKRR